MEVVNQFFIDVSNCKKCNGSSTKQESKAMKVFFAILLASIMVLPVNGSAQKVAKIVKVTSDGKRGYLGVELKDIDRKLKEKKNITVDHGVYVQSVVEDSPAEKAGLKRGDVIVKFGDETIDDAEDLIDAVRNTKPKTSVNVELYRKTEKKTIDVTVGKIKAPMALGGSTFNIETDGSDDALMKMYSTPSAPKIWKNLNVSVFSQSGIGGMKLQTLTKQLGEYFGAPNGKGALVSEVKKESNAAKAGFKAGDVIVNVDGNHIEDISDFEEEISDRDGKDVPVEIIRDRKSMKMTLTIENDDEEEDDEEEDDEEEEEDDDERYGVGSWCLSHRPLVFGCPCVCTPVRTGSGNATAR
jgi:C-terminal processing protease CtpA/Prc